MEDIIDFITNGVILDLSNLIDNGDGIECETSLANIQNDEPDCLDDSELSLMKVTNLFQTILKQLQNKPNMN